MPDDPEAIVRDANRFQQTWRQIKQLVGFDDVHKRLFFGADGQLKPSAVEWIDWLAPRAFLDDPTFDFIGDDPNGRAHAFNEGKRALALEIIAGMRLDTRRLAALRRQLKEDGDDDGR